MGRRRVDIVTHVRVVHHVAVGIRVGLDLLPEHVGHLVLPEPESAQGDVMLRLLMAGDDFAPSHGKPGRGGHRDEPVRGLYRHGDALRAGKVLAVRGGEGDHVRVDREIVGVEVLPCPQLPVLVGGPDEIIPGHGCSLVVLGVPLEFYLEALQEARPVTGVRDRNVQVVPASPASRT